MNLTRHLCLSELIVESHTISLDCIAWGAQLLQIDLVLEDSAKVFLHWKSHLVLPSGAAVDGEVQDVMPLDLVLKGLDRSDSKVWLGDFGDVSINTDCSLSSLVDLVVVAKSIRVSKRIALKEDLGSIEIVASVEAEVFQVRELLVLIGGLGIHDGLSAHVELVHLGAFVHCNLEVPGSVFWLLTLQLAIGPESDTTEFHVLGCNLELALLLTVGLLEPLNLNSSLSLCLDLIGFALVLNLQLRVLTLKLELSSLLVAFGLKLNLLGPCAILAILTRLPVIANLQFALALLGLHFHGEGLDFVVLSEVVWLIVKQNVSTVV